MKNPLYFYLCSKEAQVSTGSDNPDQPALDLLQRVTDMEGKRRKLHRELSQQAYLICPMNGEVQVAQHEIVEFSELLVMVSDFNKGKLPHSDDWFTIEDITEKRYPMELFYQFIK